jgi:hypothetical protein
MVSIFRVAALFGVGQSLACTCTGRSWESTKGLDLRVKMFGRIHVRALANVLFPVSPNLPMTNIKTSSRTSETSCHFGIARETSSG